MSDRSSKHLAVAARVDTDGLAAALLAGPPSRLENPMDLVKTMVCRTLDAAGDMLLDLAGKARDGKLAPAGGVTPRPVSFRTPWQVGFALEKPGAHGVLIAIDLDIPVDRSPSVAAKVARNTEALRARLVAEGSHGDDLEQQLLSNAVMDEIELAEKARKGALPNDLPDPDKVTKIDQIRIVRYAIDPAPAPADERFEDYAARMRPSVGTSFAKAVEAISNDDYLLDPVVTMVPSYSYLGEEEGGPRDWTPSGGADVDPTAWAEAFDRLRPVVESQGMAAALQNRAREVGERLYVSYAEPGLGRALSEIGAALAMRDGGLPGPEALSWIRSFEGQVAAARFSGIAERLGDIAESLEQGGHTDQASRFDFNDLDDTLWTTGRGNGPEVLTLTGQNGTYLVLLDRDGEGEIRGFSAARFGVPLEPYLADTAYSDPRSLDRLGYSEFHRTYANPRDPDAPLAREAALSALAEGRSDFPGFLLRLDLAGEKPRYEAMGTYSTRTIRDISNVVHGLEGGIYALDEERGTSPGMR